MTSNQIEYAKLLETRRYNEAQINLSERRLNQELQIATAGLEETRRHQIQSERLQFQNLLESSRHNVATESLDTARVAETVRHNTVSEELTSTQLSEANRHNLKAEELEASKQAETKRSNLAAEEEYLRSHLATEALKSQELSIRGQELAETARYHTMSIGLGYSQLAESNRHNLAVEQETRRSNMEHELLTSTNQFEIRREQERHNIAVETETERSNRAAESLRTTQNTETRRHNIVTEVEKGVETVSHLGVTKLIGGLLS